MRKSCPDPVMQARLDVVTEALEQSHLALQQTEARLRECIDAQRHLFWRHPDLFVHGSAAITLHDRGAGDLGIDWQIAHFFGAGRELPLLRFSTLIGDDGVDWVLERSGTDVAAPLLRWPSDCADALRCGLRVPAQTGGAVPLQWSSLTASDHDFVGILGTLCAGLGSSHPDLAPATRDAIARLRLIHAQWMSVSVACLRFDALKLRNHQTGDSWTGLELGFTRVAQGHQRLSRLDGFVMAAHDRHTPGARVFVGWYQAAGLPNWVANSTDRRNQPAMTLALGPDGWTGVGAPQSPEALAWWNAAAQAMPLIVDRLGTDGWLSGPELALWRAIAARMGAWVGQRGAG